MVTLTMKIVNCSDLDHKDSKLQSLSLHFSSWWCTTIPSCVTKVNSNFYSSHDLTGGAMVLSIRWLILKIILHKQSNFHLQFKTIIMFFCFVFVFLKVSLKKKKRRALLMTQSQRTQFHQGIPQTNAFLNNNKNNNKILKLKHASLLVKHNGKVCNESSFCCLFCKQKYPCIFNAHNAGEHLRPKKFLTSRTAIQAASWY